MSSVSLSSQISKNISKYKLYLIVLIIVLLILLFIQFILPKITKTNQNLNEGFTVTPSPSIPSSSLQSLSDLKKKIFFATNFPKNKFKKVYETKMGDNRYISFWSRDDDKDYFPVGQIAITTDQQSSVDDLDQEKHKGLSYLVKGAAFPLDYDKLWDNKSDSSKPPLSIWKVIPPKDHYAMGDLVVAGFEKPLLSEVRCLPKNALDINTDGINMALWKNPFPSNKTKEGEDISPPNSFSVWNIGQETDGFFFVNNSYQKPTGRNDKIFNIKPEIINNQEADPSESGKILKVTLKI
jgi:hypothetical protein